MEVNREKEMNGDDIEKIIPIETKLPEPTGKLSIIQEDWILKIPTEVGMPNTEVKFWERVWYILTKYKDYIIILYRFSSIIIPLLSIMQWISKLKEGNRNE